MNSVALIATLAASQFLGAQSRPGQAPRAMPAPATSASTVIVSSNGVYVGVFLAEIDSARAKALKLREERGVEVTRVEEDSPAWKAGIKVGDVVLDYNGQRVEGIEQFRRFVHETPAGREVKLAISRDGNPSTVTVKVASRAGGMLAGGPMAPMAPMGPMRIEMPEIQIPRAGGFMMWSNPGLGMEVENVEGQLAQFFGVKEGVLVRSVRKGSAAEKAGLKAGDVITKIDDAKVSGASEVMRAVRSARSKKSFPVQFVREKKESTITIQVDDEDRSELGDDDMWAPRERLAFPGRVLQM